MPRTLAAAAVIAAVTLTTADVADAKRRPKPQPCAAGTFALDDVARAKLAALLGSDVPVLTVGADRHVQLGACTATAHVHAKRKATLLEAAWKTCGSAKRLELAAKQPAPACTTLTGTLKAKRAKKIPFTATRAADDQPGGDAACGDGVLEAGEACDGAQHGCGAGARCTADCTCAPASTSQSLIADALARGDIDYPTSLVYRAWALFADSRLPPQYDGETWQFEDTALFLELSKVWNSLDDATRAALTPFTVRPDDPQSWFARQNPSARAELVAHECPYQPGADRPDWRATETAHFVVWSCGGGDPNADPDAARRAVAAGVAEDVWTKMVPETGAPIPDDNGVGPAPTGRIDVYLVTPNLCKVRDGGCTPIPLTDDGKPALAAVAPAAPCGRTGGGPFQSSSFVVLDRDHVPEQPVTTPSEFRYTFAHEFFHVVENALNLEAEGGACLDDVSTDVVNSWLVEASAEWAAWAWFPDDGRADRDALFRRFQDRGPAVSLRSQAGLHPYSAYLYPFFVQQEGGGRGAFLHVWTQGQSARSPAQLDDRVDAALPFAAHFRDFAVRNLNTTAAEWPGDPLPLAQRHQALDTAIPENFQPRIGPPTTLTAPAEVSHPATIAPLSAYYGHLVVGDDARWVRLDFGPLANSGLVQLDVIANVHGTWERRRLPGPVVEFCRDDPGDDIGELYVVASHHDRRVDAKADGSWVAQTKTSCPSGWSGVITYDEVHDDFSSVTDVNGTTVEEDHVQHRQRWVLGGTTAGPQGDVVDVAWDGTWQKHYTFRHTPSFACIGQVTYGRVTGDGAGSGTDRITFVPIPGGWQTTPDFSTQQIAGTTSHFSQICTGASTSSSEPIPLVTDAIFTAVFAAEDLALLQPATPDQKVFAGTQVLTHTVEPQPGGQSVLDVTIGWSLRKR